MTKQRASPNQATERHAKEERRDAYVRTFLRCLRAGDIMGRYGDMEADRIWGGNRTTLAIVGTLLRYPEGMPQKDIAKAIFRTKQATTIALDSLEARGFIEKSAISNDRRSNTIRLTRKGSDYHQKTLPALREMCYEAMSCLNPSEVEALNDILTKLAPTLRKRIENATPETTNTAIQEEHA